MKTLMIRDEVYKKLKIIKRKNESFSDVIDKLIKHADNRVKLEKFFGILSEKEAKIMVDEISKLRKRFK
ncbi:MAG: antitoxin VapB family protein [Candidatus Asgardarchaeia archaeon]